MKFSLTITPGDIIAALAFILSIYATLRSFKFRKQEKELLELQKKVNTLVLEKEKREAKEVNRANLSANFITFGSSKHRLKIFNKGKATAHHVNIAFPTGREIFMDSEVQSKFPMESIEPGQAVELTAVMTMRSKAKHEIHLKWQDADGKKREKTIHATI
jgi:hypothetical protein